jgi:hypothetical protein
MESNRIEELSAAGNSAEVRLSGPNRRCLYYREEVCCAPRGRFQLCRGCVRINRQAALSHLYERIKMMAHGFFKLEETELG